MEETKSPYCNCLFYSSNAMARILTKMADEEFAITGLSSSYGFLLMTVNTKPGVQPKEISMQMQLTPSTVTRLVEKMEFKGYVKRKVCGRTTEVYPTSKSLELDETIKKAWRNLYVRYAKAIGKNESIDLTTKINAATEKLSQRH